MKRLVFTLLVVGLFTGCVTESDPQIPAESITDAILVNRDLSKMRAEPEKYSFLGYGFNVRGEFQGSNAVRNQVFDIEKLSNEKLNQYNLNFIYYQDLAVQDGGIRIVSPNKSDFLKQLSNEVNFPIMGSGSIRMSYGTIDSYFPDQDLIAENSLFASFESTVKRTGIRLLPQLDCLTEEFSNDIQAMNPEALVEKYGTHYLSNVILGYKLRIIYSGKTENTDKEKAATMGLAVSMAKVFRFPSGDLDHIDEVSAKGNFSQMLSYKVVGGDPTKIQHIEREGLDYPLVSSNHWFESHSKENQALLEAEISPLYDLIQDETIKEKVKKYIDSYLQEN